MPRDLLSEQREPRDLLAEPPEQPSRLGQALKFGRELGTELFLRQFPLPVPGPIGRVPRELMSEAGSSQVATPVAGLAGIGAAVIPGGRTGAEAVEDVGSALTFRPRSNTAQSISSVAQAPMMALERAADRVGQMSGSPSDTLGATAVKTALLGAPAVMGFRAARAGTPRAPVPRRQSAPSVAELREGSRAAYQAAEDAGVVIESGSFRKAVEDIRQDLANEGIDANLHPDSMAALRRLMHDSETGNHISMKGAETLRQVINDAASSTKPADQRLARIMRDKFDDYVEGLSEGDVIAGDPRAATQALAQGRELWSRARKGEEIEELLQRAEIRSQQFTGSGYENALRTEFRQLAMNKKRMRRFTPGEQEAIRKVAAGGPVENAFRFLGRFAPRGPVSTGLGLLTGTGAGFAVGGPLGAFGPAAVLGLGELGRAGATALTRRNAQRVSALVRSGPKVNRKQQVTADLLSPQQ